MPDVSSTAPEQVRLWIALDVHCIDRRRDAAANRRHARAAAHREPERAIRRFVDRLGGPDGLAVSYGGPLWL